MVLGVGLREEDREEGRGGVTVPGRRNVQDRPDSGVKVLWDGAEHV